MVLTNYKEAFYAVSKAYRGTMYNIAECNIMNSAGADHQERINKLYE